MKKLMLFAFLLGTLSILTIGCKKSSTSSTDEAFFNWSVDNNNYKGGGNVGFQSYNGFNLISIVGNDGAGNQVSINLNGNDKGTFNFGDLHSGGSDINISINAQPKYATIYKNCSGTQDFYTSGNVIITSWSGVGTWIQGSFTGKVIGTDFNCSSPNFHTISGSFKLKRGS